MAAARDAPRPMLTSEWDKLLTEFKDVFEAPGAPISRVVDHKIELMDPNATPPKPCLYRMS